MNVARILYPVEVLGPGKRIAIWFCGCPHKCNGCANPELWSFNEKYEVQMDVLLDLIQRIVESNHVDGFTITGGEPFYQEEQLTELLSALSKWTDDILVFTGYYLEQIKLSPALKDIAVLVDGPYIKERNYGLRLRGSDNQTIHFLNKKYEPRYQEYLKASFSQIQNFMEGNSVISVGIHKPDFTERINTLMFEKGLIEGGSEK